MMKKLILASLLLTTQLFAMNGHAALFDDKEARKKIVEVEATMNSQNQATQAELAGLRKSQQALEQRVIAIEAITKGQVLGDMQNQIEALKQEVSRLKGELEVASHNVDATQQRQKDLYGDTDTRLRKLESGATPASAGQAPGKRRSCDMKIYGTIIEGRTHTMAFSANRIATPPAGIHCAADRCCGSIR